MIRDALFGLCVGDALGVPVEFRSRSFLKQQPVTGFHAYGSHNVPAGTWSDDSSLAFCLAEALTQPFDLGVIANNFVRWLHENFWTARGTVFDVGNSCRQAIDHLTRGTRPELAGGFDEEENGNGSLMRILPLLFYIKGKPINERFQVTKAVSSITHAHIRSVIACFYYLEFARKLLSGTNKFQIYSELKPEVTTFLLSLQINKDEIAMFDRILKKDICDEPEYEIHSSGYVLHTLEASIWCLLTAESYKDAVLKATNLGADTDTTASVTGGLAGLLYGFENIPADWVSQLARKDDIEDLANRLSIKYE